MPFISLCSSVCVCVCACVVRHSSLSFFSLMGNSTSSSADACSLQRSLRLAASLALHIDTACAGMPCPKQDPPADAYIVDAWSGVGCIKKLQVLHLHCNLFQAEIFQLDHIVLVHIVSVLNRLATNILVSVVIVLSCCALSQRQFSASCVCVCVCMCVCVCVSVCLCVRI